MGMRIAPVKAGLAVVSLAACLFISSGRALDAAENAAPEAGYHVIKKLTLGGEGRWDYLTIDSEARRMYISRSSHVMVVDLDTDKVVGDIPDTQGVHGIAVAPELNRGFTSNGGANTSTIFDLKTLKVLGEVKTGQNPDCIIYDPASSGSSLSTAAATTPRRSTPPPAKSSARSRSAAGRSTRPPTATASLREYQSTSEVVEIDSAKLVVTKRFPLAPGEEPSGLAVDAAHHLVFSGCHNEIMTVLDVAAGKVIASVPIGRGVDANAYDPGTGLLFSSNGDGTLTVACQTAPGKFAAENVKTQQGARTMALDLKTHNVYLATAQFEAAPAGAAPEKGRGRPGMIPNSFTVLVVGK